MLTMTRTTTPTPRPTTDKQRAVLAYYTREALEVPAVDAMAGLKLGEFRLARDQLVRYGLLEQTPDGRYKPSALSIGMRELRPDDVQGVHGVVRDREST